MTELRGLRDGEHVDIVKDPEDRNGIMGRV